LINAQDCRIPAQYRTRGQRYDDLITPEKDQGAWDKLEAFLWGENRLLDGLVKLFLAGVMGYIIGSAVRAIF